MKEFAESQGGAAVPSDRNSEPVWTLPKPNVSKTHFYIIVVVVSFFL